eukprot:TRINITY_DN16575_c0_g2_i1.p1 TRINITY_DN16575_c0_g2~~TRINITY_DN16575_c0_g2_i1.p1  ORF type:complete len:357 (+),score=127.26 TRINITY_DN16575_c0_g2_i1:152-1222(+)
MLRSLVGSEMCIRDSNNNNNNHNKNNNKSPSIRSCPGCSSNLKKLLVQQGANGGWISITAHLKKCRVKQGRTVTGLLADNYNELEQLAAEQCQRLAEAKAARKADQPARRAAAKAAAEDVPWFIARQRRKEPATPAEEPAVCCPTCSAEFAAKDRVSFQQHADKCGAKKKAQAKHLEQVCLVTQQKAEQAIKRVQALARPVARAKAQLKAKQDAVETAKRQKHQLRGKKNKTLKKSFVYHAEEPETPELDECTVHGCLQRIKEAEKSLEEARKRAEFRKQTAEIAKAAAEGVLHPALKQRSVDSRAKAEQKRLANFRKGEKRKSKEVRSEERKCKSMAKATRRAGADSKYLACTGY